MNCEVSIWKKFIHISPYAHDIKIPRWFYSLTSFAYLIFNPKGTFSNERKYNFPRNTTRAQSYKYKFVCVYVCRDAFNITSLLMYFHTQNNFFHRWNLFDFMKIWKKFMNISLFMETGLYINLILINETHFAHNFKFAMFLLFFRFKLYNKTAWRWFEERKISIISTLIKSPKKIFFFAEFSAHLVEEWINLKLQHHFVDSTSSE